MTDWTDGYVADIGYTYGYYAELNPLHAHWALLSAGYAPPAQGTHCELGFGQGLSVNIHAAAGTGVWFGTDFNPAQAGFARTLAQVSGASAHLYDEGFADFCHRTDLPEFDSVGLHGIWSWISDENRAHIVHLLQRRLKVGGVLYISYNTQPGWASMVPVRDLLCDHAAVMSAPGHGIVTRIDAALDFGEQLLAVNPQYTRANPLALERLKKLKSQNRQYLAHEYFNRDWLPMPFSQMAQWLSPAKLSYACSAHYLDHTDVINLTAEQRALVEAVPDPIFRQTVRDFCVNQQFRRDVWVKGGQRLDKQTQARALASVRLRLVSHRPEVSLTVNAGLGSCTLFEQVYAPILDAMADHAPRSLTELESVVQRAGVNSAQLHQAALILAGAGHLVQVQDDAIAAQAFARCQKLNAHIMDRALVSGDIGHLASPVTGGGVAVGRFQQLFLRQWQDGVRDPAEWARHVWNVLQGQGLRVVKQGVTLEVPDDNLAELNRLVTVFIQAQLPVLKALQVAQN